MTSSPTSASYTSVSASGPGASASASGTRPGAEGAQAMAEMLATIDSGSLSGGAARSFEDRGASLRQGLAYAMSAGRTRAILELAYNCAVRLSDADTLASSEEVMSKASDGDWGFVAYHAAIAADVDGDGLDDLVEVPDGNARKEFRRLAGEVRAQLPRDLRQKFTRLGKLPPSLLVEQPRWLLPRPRKDQVFLGPDGSQLEDGWYSVVQYPLGDDLKEALLRRKYWGHRKDAAVSFLRRSGETLLCKAVKAGQWELAEWLVEQHGSGSATVRLAGQVQDEFSTLWEGIERTACLQSHEDVVDLSACLDDRAELRRPWRLGALQVPTGSRLRSPRLETLREALDLGPLSIQALHLVGGAKATFVLPSRPVDVLAWRSDLAGCGESAAVARPLLHRAAEAGRCKLVARLLKAMVNAESRDSRGLTALAVAASRRRLEALGALLDGGCRVEGPGGALAMAAAQRFAKPGDPDYAEDEAEQWSEMYERLCERHRRAPAVDLEEYFKRQARGEIVHGTEPRRYELREGELRLCNGGSLRVTTRCLALDGDRGRGEERAPAKKADERAEDLDVCFVCLEHSSYMMVVDAGILDLSRHRLYTEQQLIDRNLRMAAPVAVPRGRLTYEGTGGEVTLRTIGDIGALAAAMPLLARAPPLGGLAAESMTCCCKSAIGRVDIIIDGIRVGETLPPGPPPDYAAEEVKLSTPARELDVVAEMSGRRLLSERIVGEPDAKVEIMVGLAIYIYVQPLGEESADEFVFVCGHRRDVPDDALPFVGKITWDTGAETLANHKLAVLEASSNMSCLARLQSMRLLPDLSNGRRFEAVEWEDTESCQYARLLLNPVRVGKISNA